MTKFLGFFIFVLLLLGKAQADVRLVVDSIDSNKSMTLTGRIGDAKNGQILALKSHAKGVGIFGYVKIVSIDRKSSRVKAELVKTSQYNLIKPGDQVVDFNLSTESDDYHGSTELLIREDEPSISARFKPLFTQGFAIGDTSQTLWTGEYLLTWYGLLYYGLTDWFTVGTWVPGNFSTTPNLNFKLRFIDVPSVSAATGLNFTRDPENSNRWLVNFNLLWDFYTTQSTVSHTFATVAIYAIEKAEQTTAVKAAGTSTFQTGYEYIFDNWSRLLAGPNYNFETKTIGGYLAYVKIWDRFHLQGTLYSTNVRNVRWSTTDGYFGYIDAYWRF
jgi:hypothetical protein